MTARKSSSSSYRWPDTYDEIPKAMMERKTKIRMQRIAVAEYESRWRIEIYNTGEAERYRDKSKGTEFYVEEWVMKRYKHLQGFVQEIL